MFRVDDRFRQFLTYAAIGVINTAIHWGVFGCFYEFATFSQSLGLFNCCDVFLRYERKVHFSEATKFCRLHQDDHYYGLHFLGYRLVRGSK